MRTPSSFGREAQEAHTESVSIRLRAGRRTNIALFGVLTLAFATGWLAFGVGTPGAAAIVTAAHAIAGLAVVVLVPWKRIVVRRAARRRSGMRPWLEIALGFLVALALLTGVLHAVGGYAGLFGLTAMQVHVGAALVAVPLFLFHVWEHRQPLHRVDVSRRHVLGAGALVGASTALYVGTERVAALASLPGSDRRSTGSHERGSDDPAAMPVTQWFDDTVQSIDQSGWRLTITDGSMTRQIELDELAAATDEFRTVLDCTGGWYAIQDWRGLRLDRLLPTDATARSIDVVSATGYRRRFPISDAERLLLATHAAGQPISPGHGAPVRLVAPGRRGFWWVKWVERVELRDEPWWWQPPFPLT